VYIYSLKILFVGVISPKDIIIKQYRVKSTYEYIRGSKSKMTNYQNGKVYMIEALNGEEGDIYVGSTAKQYLSQRMTFHRLSYKYWKEGKADYVTAYDLFDKYGIENCSIILLETCPCNTRDELRSREGFHIRNLECVNKKMAGRTPAEYYVDNSEEIKQKSRDYRILNPDKILEASKNYYDNNKESLKDKSSNYYANNKEKVNVRNKQYNESHKEAIAIYKKEHYEKNKIRLQEKITCECGSTCSRMGMLEHKKTTKHKNYENSLIQT
jgi:hypothetical protein